MMTLFWCMNLNKETPVLKLLLIIFFNVTYYKASNNYWIGIPEGKFLEKGKYKNTEKSGATFLPVDLMVGKDVKINGFSFKIIECDEFTLKWYFFYCLKYLIFLINNAFNYFL